MAASVVVKKNSSREQRPASTKMCGVPAGELRFWGGELRG